MCSEQAKAPAVLLLGKTILCCLLVVCSGCSLMEIRRQTTLADNVGILKGRIEVSSSQKGPVMVLRFKDEDGIPVLQRSVVASENGEYVFQSAPGRYYIGAYIDANMDRVHQPEEHGNYFGDPTIITVAEKQTVTVEDITISGPVPISETDVKYIDRSWAAWRNIGSVVTFDDPRFNQENYAKGLWEPLDFMEKAEGGLFFLEEYDEKKIPVLFVHGVVNGPTLWKDLVESIDRKHFQPWLFYYPSGLRLDSISTFLVEAVSQLHEKYKFDTFFVVAHSMGGLIARSFVKNFVELNPDHSKMLSMVMTVNSPMNGMSAASSGVEYSPIIVPSWRDVKPDSEFLKNIHNWKWPVEIPYYLVISYLDGESGDGVVPLQSQAQFKLQSEATRIYLFNNEHTEIIDSKDFHLILNQILENKRKE